MRYQSLFCCGLVVTLLLCGCSSSTKNNKDSSIEESSVITESDDSVISETEESSEQEESSRGLKTSSEIAQENLWKKIIAEKTFTLEDVKQAAAQAETESEKQGINSAEYMHHWFESQNSRLKYNPFSVPYDPVEKKIGNYSSYRWYSLNHDDTENEEFVCFKSFVYCGNVVYHVVLDKNKNVLSQDIVFTPEEPDSDGLTIEEAKEIIKNIVANPPSEVRSVEYYILSEFSKKTAPTFVVEGENHRTFFEMNCGTDKKGTIECIGWTFGWEYYNKVPQETPITYRITNASTHEIIDEGILYDPKAQ